MVVHLSSIVRTNTMKTQDRIRAAAQDPQVATAAVNVEEATAAAAAAVEVVVEGNAAAATDDEECDSEDERCGVCFEGIQRKVSNGAEKIKLKRKISRNFMSPVVLGT